MAADDGGDHREGVPVISGDKTCHLYKSQMLICETELTSAAGRGWRVPGGGGWGPAAAVSNSGSETC